MVEINVETTVVSAGLDQEINPLIEAEVRHPRDQTKIAFKNESKMNGTPLQMMAKKTTVPPSKSIVITNGIKISSDNFSLKSRRFRQMPVPGLQIAKRA